MTYARCATIKGVVTPSSDFSFLEASAPQAAAQLLGCMLQRRLGDKLLSARIVETEAYDQTDAASHSYKGVTPRTKIMFGPAGYLYVYFSYGMHYCCNVVVGQPGQGAAVLIRAVEPLEGLDEMEQRRHGSTGLQLTNGPAKVCQALGIDKQLNGHNLHQQPLQLIPAPPLAREQIVQTARIGISQATDTPWRFYIPGSLFVSKKRRY